MEKPTSLLASVLSELVEMVSRLSKVPVPDIFNSKSTLYCGRFADTPLPALSVVVGQIK